MATDKTSLFYRDGKLAFLEGKELADKPFGDLTNEWNDGFVDAAIDALRALMKKDSGK